MAGKNDQNFNQSTLEEWKLKMFLDIAGMRDGRSYQRAKEEGTGGAVSKIPCPAYPIAI